ncbi:MAG: FAD-binding oxidoreductase [Acidimicrobiales bacterium]
MNAAPPPLSAAAAAMAAIVGAPHVRTGDDAAPYGRDWRGLHDRAPALVVRPGTVSEAADVVACAAEYGLTVVPIGGNTGLAGAAAVVDDHTLLLSTERLTMIRKIDAVGGTITAEAGVTIGALQAAAAEAGAELGLDWGARDSATLGGAISTDAGGSQVLRWGTTRDRLLGLEVVLPDGRVLDLLRALRKNSTGPGLVQLFAGAEGTLGLITAATLRLEPAPADRATALLGCRSLPDVLDVYRQLRGATGGDLVAFELLPDRGVDAVVELRRGTRPIGAAPWLALVEIAGDTGAAERLAGAIAELVDDGAAGDVTNTEPPGAVTDAVIAADERQRTALWHLRDELPPEPLLGRKGVKYDLAVPTSAIPALVAEIEERVDRTDDATWRDLELYCFGHVGDGNLHLYLLPTDGSTALPDERRGRLEAEIDQLVWHHRGTISAEHGVGLALVDRIAGQVSATELDVLAAVARAIDPDGRFNPGKGPLGSPEARH